MKKIKTNKGNLKNHFYLSTDIGMVHVNMDANSDKEVFYAINKMVKLAYNKVNQPWPK